MPDITEQSTCVDDYLGHRRGEERTRISMKISKIEESLKTLDFNTWEALFE
jgi:hypothetical protein